MRLFLNMGMPLLGKELTEQAARKRTYVVRVVYATLLFIAFALMFQSIATNQRNGWGYVLGSGGQMFDNLFMLQFFGILLFLPAMMSGTITTEKEQASLALLFLTDMGPWELLLQKYLGRLIPMFSFLMLAWPLMAIAYSFGGISSAHLWAGILLLVLTCLQMGALALMCSTICRTTVGAFLLCYIGGAVFYLGPGLVFEFLGPFRMATRSVGMGWRSVQEVVFNYVPLYVFETDRGTFSRTLTRSIPCLLWAIAFLVAARVFLVRRAFSPARNPLLRVFKRLDRVFTRWNSRVGGIEFGARGTSLPEEEPVAWRELQKRALGRSEYLCRLGLLIEVPALFISFATMWDANYWRRSGGVASVAVWVIWILALLTMTVQGANAFVAERTHQTLDVLMTTPLAAVDIVNQKMRALRRLYFLFAVPLLTLLAMWVWWETGWRRDGGRSASDIIYPWATLLEILIYLPLMAWFSLWVGMRVRTRFRAIMTALIALVCWCVLPPAVIWVLYAADPLMGTYLYPNLVLIFSPASSVVITETSEWSSAFEGFSYVAFFLNFILYGAILYGLRRMCLRNAERYLRGE